ncbi:MAG: hypothetical protein MMC33_003644 [Icmadophila ericetorum]|nr:hypothetical protein [Icmadophila ericetorum]
MTAQQPVDVPKSPSCRVKHTTFGSKADGTPYTVELGANWALKYKLVNTYSNYSSIETFDQTGAVDYSNLLNDYDNAFTTVSEAAGNILSENLQDRSFRSGLSLAGWKPKKNMRAQASEWWQFDWEYGESPDLSSQEWAIINYNTSFNQFSPDNQYVYDQRGFNAFIIGEASTYLKSNDPRLLLNTIVTKIAYDDDGVTVTNQDGSCIQADYAVCTFSLGVLQNDAVQFSPALPHWKQLGIDTFTMATYTKIFLQFPSDKVFWDRDTQFFLYADPLERGYYPVWQSLDGPGFLEGSGIFFVTVVTPQSYVAEAQTDEETKAQVLAVLRDMFGAENVPEPTAFLYPRWSEVPWAYGSYSNWPPGTTLATHQNLRAPLNNRLFFAGEATSAEYYGFLHGAYFEGQLVGTQIAGCVKGEGDVCAGDGNVYYSQTELMGTTPVDSLNETNGWMVSSFLDPAGN